MRCQLISGLVLLTTAVLAGCGPGGPALGTVEGTVTLDGAPLPEAEVTFSPEEGRSSVGITDQNGRYDLDYASERKGALVGTHSVTVRTEKTTQKDDGTDEVTPEKIPAKYNAQTELEYEVKSGSNTIDLELDSDGPLPQTDKEGEYKDPAAC